MVEVKERGRGKPRPYYTIHEVLDQLQFTARLLLAHVSRFPL